MRSGFIMLLSLLCLLCTHASAQDGDASRRYISDETAITLRQDKGMNAPVAALLKSGTRVELLEDDKASGYARVRVAPGREGWVLARYLSNEPAARERLGAMQSQLTEQQASVRKLEADNLRLREAAGRSPRGLPAAEIVQTAGLAPAAVPEAAPRMRDVVSMVTGAGLFVAGLLAGLLIPLIPTRGARRSRWSAEL